MRELKEYDFGGRPQSAINLCCLISEMEGTYQHLKYMGFKEDMETMEEMKARMRAEMEAPKPQDTPNSSTGEDEDDLPDDDAVPSLA